MSKTAVPAVSNRRLRKRTLKLVADRGIILYNRVIRYRRCIK